MSEIAIREAHGIAVPDYRAAAVAERDIIDGWIGVMGDVAKLADYIAETDFVPKALRNRPAAVAACILTGRELNIGPMQALKSIHMVQGVPGLSAEYKRARALAAGHEIVFDETNSNRCVVRGRRAGSERWVTITWTIDMAKRAKLAGKDVWQAYPQRMLQARASSELCDILFPDASLGLATTEVLEDGGITTAAGQVVDAATGEVTGSTQAAPAIEAPKGRTAQRKTRTAAKAEQPKPAPADPQPDAALPPLPGEEEPRPTAPAAVTPTSGAAATPDDTTYDTPGTVSDPQLKAIWTVLGQVFHFDKEEKDQARKVCAHIVQHELASSKDLSHNEAKAVLDTLGHWQHQASEAGEDARAWMLTMLAGAGTTDAQ